MRWMPLFLLALCLPLSAGDADVLNAAVKSFESDSGAVRQNASTAVRRYLEKELAPLIKAMKSTDPEVARRAREAITGLLPWEDAGDQNGVIRQAGNVFQVVNVGGRNNVRIILNNGQAVWVQNNQQQHAKTIGRFGVSGYPCQQRLVRLHLGLAAGRGYVVSKVQKGSSAQKIGLLVNDIILSIDGRPVMMQHTFSALLAKQIGWLKLRIRLVRNGKLMQLPQPGKFGRG